MCLPTMEKNISCNPQKYFHYYSVKQILKDAAHDKAQPSHRDIFHVILQCENTFTNDI